MVYVPPSTDLQHLRQRLAPENLDTGIENRKAVVEFNGRMRMLQEQMRIQQERADEAQKRKEWWSSVGNNLKYHPLTASTALFTDKVLRKEATPDRQIEMAKKREQATLTELSTLFRGLADQNGVDAARERADGLFKGHQYEQALRNAVEAALDGYEPTVKDDDYEGESLRDDINPLGIDVGKNAEATEVDDFETLIKEATSGFAPADSNAPKPKQEAWQNSINTTVRSLLDGAINVVEVPDIVIGFLGEAAFGEKDSDLPNVERYRPYRDLVEELRFAASYAFPPDKAREHDFATKLSQGAGSYMMFLFGGMGLANMGVKHGTAMLGASMQSAQGYNDALSYNARAGQKFVSFLMNAGLGLTEAAPIDRLFRHMARDTGEKFFTRLLAETPAATLQEFTQEFLQAAGEDAIAKYGFFGMSDPYNPSRKMDVRDWLEQGFVGGILGFGGGAVVAASGGGPRPVTLAEIENLQSQLRTQIKHLKTESAKISSEIPTSATTEAPLSDGIDGQVAASIVSVADMMREGDMSGVQFEVDKIAANATRIANIEKAAAKGEDVTKLKNPRTVIKGPKGQPDFVVGEGTTEDWIARISATLTPDQIAEAAVWYEKAPSVFYDKFDDPQVAELVMTAWLASQQNISVEGGMRNVLMQAEQFAKGYATKDMKAGGLPSATGAIRTLLSGEKVKKGIGPKIADFIDSANGKTTRTWVGDKAEGGAPAVVDVHTARDFGLVDEPLLNHLERLGYKVPKNVQIDWKGSVEEGRYEATAKRIRKMTDDLNSQKWGGRSDWKPHQVQAVGWMSMLKMTQEQASDTDTAWEKNRYDLSFEIDGGDGSAMAAIFGEELDSLNPEQRAYVTRHVSEVVWEAVHKVLPTVSVTALTHGEGAWMNHHNPSATGGIYASSWEQAQAAANVIGELLEQTEVWAVRPKEFNPDKWSAKAGPTDLSIEVFAESGRDRSTLDEVFRRMIQLSTEHEGEPHVQGYSPITSRDGREGIRIITRGTGETKADKRRSMIALSEQLTSETAQRELSKLVPDMKLSFSDADLYIAETNWELANAGEEVEYKKRRDERKRYANQYREITGRDFKSDFRGVAQKVRAETVLAIQGSKGFARGTESRADALAVFAGNNAFSNDEGQITLTHWSNDRHNILDPAFAGTGPLHGAERKGGNRWVFFGVGVGKKKGYQKEMLGDVRHEVEMPAGAFYNIAEDLLDFYDLAEQQGITGPAAMDEVIASAKALGYQGVYNPAHPQGAMAISFGSVKPSRVFDDTSGEQVVHDQPIFGEEEIDAQTSIPFVRPVNEEGQHGYAFVGPAQSENFKKWFRNSVVVADSKGSPMRVFHGSTAAGFRNFKTPQTYKNRTGAIFFTDEIGKARTYAGYDAPILDFPEAEALVRSGMVSDGVRWDYRGDGMYMPVNDYGKDYYLEPVSLEDAVQEAKDNIDSRTKAAVYDVYLRLENPVYVDFKGHNWNNSPSTEYILEHGDNVQYFPTEEEAFAAMKKVEFTSRSEWMSIVVEREHGDAPRVVKDTLINYLKNGGATLNDIQRKDGKISPVDIAIYGMAARDAGVMPYAELSKIVVSDIAFTIQPQINSYVYRLRKEVLAEWEAAGGDPVVYATDGGKTTDEIVSEAFEDPTVDGVIFENIVDSGGRSSVWTEPATVYAVREETQVKSASANGGQYDPSDPDILASVGVPAGAPVGTSSARMPFIDEPVRDTAGVPKTEWEGSPEDAIALSDIAAYFTQLMDLTVRQGRMTLRGADIMGEYKRKAATTRLRFWDDVSTLFHEAGHALHDKMDGALRPLMSEHKVEIVKAAFDLYQGDLAGASHEKRIREGFAELFRLFVQNRAKAEERAPNFTAAFDALLQDADPKISKGLLQVGQMMELFNRQTSVDHLGTMIKSGRRTAGMAAVIEDIRELGAQKTASVYFNEAARQGIDNILPLRQLVAKLVDQSADNGRIVDLNVAQDPAKKAQLARNAGHRGMMSLLHGAMGYHSTNASTRSLQDAIHVSQGFPDNAKNGKMDMKRHTQFGTYLMALRAREEYQRFVDGEIKQRPINAHLGDIEQTIHDLEAQYGDAFIEGAAIVNEYGKQLWETQYAAGLLTKEQYQSGIDREFYAPLLRDMSDKGLEFRGSRGGELTSGRQPLLKRFGGSTRDVIHPMDALVQKTFSLEETVWRNDIVKSLAALADDAGTAGALVERIPAHKMVSQSVTLQEVAKQIVGDENIGDQDAADLLAIIEPLMDRNTMLRFFKADVTGKNGSPLLFYWDSGKLQALEINDLETANGVIALLEGIGNENMTLGLELMSLSSNVFRATITSWPDFIAVNFVRDQMQAWLTTDVGFIPFISGFRGAADEITQSKIAKQYNASMGTMGGAGTAQLDGARVDQDIRHLTKKGYRALVFGGGLTGFMKGITKVTEVSETATRLGLFKAALNRAKADGLSDWDASIEAAFTATDYMDFGLHGDKTLLFRRTIPFLSAQVNGMYKMWRTLGATETARRIGFKRVLAAYFKGTSGMELTRAEQRDIATGRKAWIKMVSLSLLSFAIHAAFRDDPDYQEASEYLRTTGWVIPTGNGEIVYIPKPFEWAIVANAIERGLEFSEGDEAAGDRFIRGLFMQLSAPVAPPLIKTAYEVNANYNSFQERPIIQPYQQTGTGIDPALAVNAYTSQLAKDIGGVMGWRPIIVDYWMQNMGASAARDLSTLYDQMMNKNAGQLASTDAPMLRRFFRDSSRGSTAIRDFWRQMNGTDGEMQGAATAYRKWLSKGDPARAEQLLMDMDDGQQAFALLQEHFSAKEKRIHPMRRMRDLSSVVSGMRTQMRERGGLADTTVETDLLATVPLTAKQRTMLDQELYDYTTREARNTMIYMGQEGWAHREPTDLSYTLEAIRAISTQAAQELERRMSAAKVYDGAVVEQVWPEVRERLLSDRADAYLGDLVSLAKEGN